MKTPKLFISYRRDGGEALAFLLNDRLKQKGYSVFYDIESLHAGKFDQRIFSEIEACDHFVLVLSAGALDRCVNENDWVRWEIAHALKHKKNIVPVMMRGFMFPENLPGELAEISSINGVLFESMSLMDARIEQLITFFSPAESDAVSQNPLLERAFMALEDGEWKQADNFCEQVLNTEPRNAQAYLAKLMAELRVYQKEDLAKLTKPFDDSPHYSKIMRFGDLDFKNEICGYIQEIKNRNEQIRLQNLYASTQTAMENAHTESEFHEAAKRFSELGSYKDAVYLSEKCLEKAETVRKNAIYDTALSMEKNAQTEEDFKKAAELFQKISDYRDSDAFLTKIRRQIEQIKEQSKKEEQRRQQRDIIKKVQPYISEGYWHTVGLQSDGTVVAVGDNYRGVCEVSAWRDIVAVSAGRYHTVG